MKILSVRTENILRCQLAEVNFKDDVVVLGGMNGNGKTSFANSIWMAFGGKDAIPDQPVTEGADVGTIDIVLDGDFVLSRRVYPDRQTVLELRDKEGGKYKRPQELLDAFNLKFGFWPQDFIMMKPDKQKELLRALVGLDFSAIDRKIEALTEKRRDIGRERDQLQGQYDGMPAYEGAPVQEESIAALSQQLRDAHEAQRQRDTQKRRAVELRERAEEHLEEVKELLERIDDLKTRAANCVKEAEAIEAVKYPEQLDTTEIEKKIGTLEETNAKVRANQARAEVLGKLNKKTVEYEDETAKIQAQKDAKEKALRETKFPVEGLGFGENGITFQGKPFEQASTAQQWEVAVGIGFGMNPELKLVYIQYGPLLDENTLERIKTMIREKGGQLLLETVGNGEDVTVVFENGVGRSIPKKKSKEQSNEERAAV